MQRFDGESDRSDIDDAMLTSAESKAKLEALRQVGSAVQTYCELAADDVEPRFDGMWSKIENAISSDEHVAQTAVVKRIDTKPAEARGGVFDRLKAWFENRRGHIFVGTAAAAAAAALVLMIHDPNRDVPAEQTARETRPVQPAQPPPMTAVSSPPLVEQVSTSGSTTTFVLDDSSGSAVIWIDENESSEDPI